MEFCRKDKFHKMKLRRWYMSMQVKVQEKLENIKGTLSGVDRGNIKK